MWMASAQICSQKPHLRTSLKEQQACYVIAVPRTEYILPPQIDHCR
ncbi:hypothetical protein [Nocardiopsis xinjiangensis]|nr:hypothetical protein [Nocardiopsis xinjiangensis]